MRFEIIHVSSNNAELEIMNVGNREVFACDNNSGRELNRGDIVEIHNNRLILISR
jgi:hypothetical protein